MAEDPDASANRTEQGGAPAAGDQRGAFAVLTHLWTGLAGRKIFQWGIAYAVVAFGLLQTLDIIGNTLDWPPAADRSFLAIIVVGFAVAVILAWFHGEKGRQTISRAEAGMLGASGVACLTLLTIIWLPGGQPAQATIAAAGNVPRLAVMRLDNLGDTEPYFAEGVADELISEVGKINGLEVVARASSFTLTGDRATPANAGKELGATLVLTGSVRKLEGKVRVQAQLVSAPAGTQIWSETFEKPAGEIYSLQRDIALRIAKAAQLEVTRPPHRRVDPEAYRLYLEARRGEALKAVTPTTLTSDQTDLFRKAVELDPGFAEAWSALGRNEYMQVAATTLEPTVNDLQPAQDASDRALAIDPALAEAWVNKSDIAALTGRWADADRFAAEAVKYPGYHPFFAYSLTGREEEALRLLRKAQDLDPFSLRTFNQLTHMCELANDLKCRLDAARRQAELVPGRPDLQYEYFRALIANGDKETARGLLKANWEEWKGDPSDPTDFTSQQILSFLGDAQPLTREQYLAGWDSDPQIYAAALEGLAMEGRGADIIKLLPKAPPVAAKPYFVTFIYYPGVADLRRSPEFWDYAGKAGLAGFWRETGKWPDFCKTEPVCEAHLGKRKS